MKALESMKANVVISIKPKGKRESYFVSDVNNNSWITSDNSATKGNT